MLPCPSRPRRGLSGPSEIASHARAVDVRNAVVTRQPLVHEREVGVEQVDDAAVLLHDRAEEQLRLALERLAQVAVEVRRVGPGILQVAQQQPLAGEVADERLGARVGQHAAHLLFERRRILERAALRRREQLVVRDAAPEEERQPRRQLVVTEAERRARRDARRLAVRNGRGTADRRARARPPAGCRSSNEPARARRDRTAAASPCRARRRNGPAVGARRERIEDLRRARVSWLGVHDEQSAPARRVAGAGRVERTGNDDLRDPRRARRCVVDAIRAGDARARDHRGRDRVRSRRHLHARRATSLQRDALSVERHVWIVGAASADRRRDGHRRPPRPPGRTRHRAETCGE